MNQYIIERLKEGRLNKGLKQSDVTRLIGIKNTTLSNYENGNTEPDMDTFLKLCHLYGLDYSELLSEAYGYQIPDNNINIKKSDLDLIKKYRALDSVGRDHVDTVLHWETDRMKQLESSKTPAVRTINYYYRLASAGTGQIVFDMPPTRSIEIPDIPEYKKADYAIGVNGSSMEPTYYDGDVLLVEMTDHIDIGEIGIFLVDGQSYVKQRGRTELISLNKNSKNVPLTPDSRCMGRVITKLEP